METKKNGFAPIIGILIGLVVLGIVGGVVVSKTLPKLNSNNMPDLLAEGMCPDEVAYEGTKPEFYLKGQKKVLASDTQFQWVEKNCPNLKQRKSSAGIAQFIQADFIDLDKIEAISKFRSGSGHDFSQGTGETCRSMKHYFNVAFSEESERLRRQNNGLPPPPDGKGDIKIYSPVDGKITSIKTEQMPIGEQIFIEVDSAPGYTIRLFHIYKLDGVKAGKVVKAGEQIGVIGQYQNTDIAIEKRSGFKNNLISYFEVMPDSIFEKYKARGIKDRSELILSKEYRDANPLKCNGEQFSQNSDSDPNSGNFINLK